MEEKMRLLIGLQACDARIRGARGRMEALPLLIQELETRLAGLEDRLRREMDELEEKRRERRRMDQEMEIFDGRIEKSQIKLSNIKSNKEYRAALKEIEDLKFEKARLEESALGMMEEIEGIEKKSRADKAELEDMRRTSQAEREAIEKERGTLTEALEGLQRERGRLCGAIDADLLKQYDFLAEKKRGLAVSAVVKGICQTCHMGIPPQKFNELIRGNVLMTCPNCNRIIYWGDSESLRSAV